MTNGIVFCLRFFGLILSAVTTVFTVVLWSELPTIPWAQWLMGFTGFALEGSKFLLLILSAHCFTQRRWLLSALAGSLSLLLFVVSIAASVGFLEKSEQQAKRNSWHWQQKTKILNQLDQEIALLTETAKRDLNNGYRDRALTTQRTIEDLRSDKAKLITEKISENATSTVSGISSLIGLENAWARLAAWLLLAVLIDVVAGACWVFLSLLKTVPAPVESGLQDKTAEPDRTDVCSLETVSETVLNTVETVSTRRYSCASQSLTLTKAQEKVYSSVKEKILNSVPGYDENMSLKQLMRLESIGYAKARAVMDKLELEARQTD